MARTCAVKFVLVWLLSIVTGEPVIYLFLITYNKYARINTAFFTTHKENVLAGKVDMS